MVGDAGRLVKFRRPVTNKTACVDTTARSCFNRGWETIIAGDAAASAGHEQHRRALVGFEFAFGEVLETEEVLERLK